MLKRLTCLLALLIPIHVLATNTNNASDAELEKRLAQLTEGLRCLVCQNQTIADSHSGLAIDLKNQVREKMLAGESDQAITNYMVQRYGDFVLYKPPVKNTTWLLWFGPFLLLLVATSFLFFRLRRRRIPSAMMTSGELARINQLLH
jgi:cytochrome c-type biogenesis protein CcmH